MNSRIEYGEKDISAGREMSGISVAKRKM